MMKKRKIDVVVLSDIHLGTYGSHANELLNYLGSIEPNMIVLNGDIIDIWNLRLKYFPTAHTEVLRKLLKMAGQGIKIYYIPGNHDEAMRKYHNLKLGNIKILEKLIINLDGKKHWMFHGDVFDATTKGSAKIIAKLGGKGYDLLIWINRWINKLLLLFGKEQMSFSKKVKSGVKKAVSWINNFEDTAIELALKNQYDYVICGHIHQPQIRTISKENRTTTYLNSGDWVENLTALEYFDKQWSIYHYNKAEFPAGLKQIQKEIKSETKMEPSMIAAMIVSKLQIH
ncbi:MAG: UDP-2,3-diacylglucosamine diphosphatase [Saprospiraceae bacterium]|jgi:UDP-2,3-diacylglucosamine pyrophosphatase LpxH|nr:UDP-2,3-diacylglucosamine diphosphatase [Saprospiraceae bacterium]MBP7922605.1 UDP-2,3-diacylglucosamine diphosphatase [Saprospiraceae bacterium]MBP8093830.1 UDP-2,3-diacylglucosamine diphosphatase [Saprospiraceae bacterium]